MLNTFKNQNDHQSSDNYIELNVFRIRQVHAISYTATVVAVATAVSIFVYVDSHNENTKTDIFSIFSSNR